MKRLLIAVFAVALLSSVFCLTACQKQGDSIDGASESAYSEAEESSLSQRTKASGQAPASSQAAPHSSASGGAGGTSQKTSVIYTPTDGSFSYQTPKTSVTVDTNVPYTLVTASINSLATPALTDVFYNYLIDTENAYNKLSASDKGLVTNYGRLQEARVQFDYLSKLQAERLIDELPEPTEDNTEEFGASVAVINACIEKISSENRGEISNLDKFNALVQKADAVFVDAFIEAVGALGAFDPASDYTEEYLQKIERAKAAYGLVPATSLSSVAGYRNTLSSIESSYTDTGIVKGFLEIYAKLPAVSAVSIDDKTVIYAAQSAYIALTASQKGLIPVLSSYNADAVASNVSALVAEIRKISPVYEFVRSLESNKSSKKKTFDDGVVIEFASGWSTNSGTSPFSVNGTALKDSFANGTTITITGLKAGGTLYVYAIAYNAESVDITIDGVTETIDKNVSEPTTFTIAAGGDHTLTFGASVKVYGIIIE